MDKHPHRDLRIWDYLLTSLLVIAGLTGLSNWPIYLMLRNPFVSPIKHMYVPEVLSIPLEELS